MALGVVWFKCGVGFILLTGFGLGVGLFLRVNVLGVICEAN